MATMQRAANRPVTLSGSGASLAPGGAIAGVSQPGTLTVVGDFTTQGSSRLLFQLDGSSGPSGSGNDRVPALSAVRATPAIIVKVAM